MAASHDTLGAAAPKGHSNERFGWPISQEAFDKILAAVPQCVANPAPWRYFLRALWEGGYRADDLLQCGGT